MENLPRPAPARSLGARLADWVSWVGGGRLALSTAAVVVVCAGAFWLTRAPQPPTEAALPRATVPGTVEASAAVAASTVPALAGPGSVTTNVLVHVTGAVVDPGVYELPAGARVQAAVEAAGGAAAGGNPDALNLAAVVTDGARIYVPLVGEEVPLVAGTVGSIAPVGPLDVNRATADELDELPGVGPATAAAIVAERERNGPFPTVDDLERVPGIGPAKLASLRDLVTT